MSFFKPILPQDETNAGFFCGCGFYWPTLGPRITHLKEGNCGPRHRCFVCGEAFEHPIDLNVHIDLFEHHVYQSKRKGMNLLLGTTPSKKRRHTPDSDSDPSGTASPDPAALANAIFYGEILKWKLRQLFGVDIDFDGNAAMEGDGGGVRLFDCY